MEAPHDSAWPLAVPLLVNLVAHPAWLAFTPAERVPTCPADDPQAIGPPEVAAAQAAQAPMVPRIDARVDLAVAFAAALSTLVILAAAGFTRLRADRALDHPRRAQIRAIVQAQPGIETSTLARQLSIPRTRARHHVAKMEELGLLRIVRAHGRTALFPAETATASIHKTLLQRQAVGRVHELLRSSGPLGQAEIARSLGLSQPRTSFLLRSLQGARLVEAVRQGRRLQYATAATGPPSNRPEP